MTDSNIKLLVSNLISDTEIHLWKKLRERGTIAPWKEQALSLIEGLSGHSTNPKIEPIINNMIAEELKNFLKWMAKNNIDSVLPFFAYQDGRNGKIPHWTNGNRLYNIDELVKKYMKTK